MCNRESALPGRSLKFIIPDFKSSIANARLIAVFFSSILACFCGIAPAAAEDLYPLLTRSALVHNEPVSAGLEFGCDDHEAVAFSRGKNSTRSVWQAPRIRFTLPWGEHAVVRADWSYLYLKSVDFPTRVGSVMTPGDPRVEATGTFAGWKPGGWDLGGLLAAKVPSARDEIGAGTDQIDLEIAFLASHRLGPARFHFNAGLFLRDAPSYARDRAGVALAGQQDDLLRAGVALSWFWGRNLLMLECHAENCSRYNNDYVYLNAGLRVPASQRWTWYALVGKGLTDEAADFTGRLGVARSFQ